MEGIVDGLSTAWGGKYSRDGGIGPRAYIGDRLRLGIVEVELGEGIPSHAKGRASRVGR